MVINLPFLQHPIAKTALKILNLEASQLSLPDSEELMKRTLGAYAGTQFGAQLLEHSFLGSLIYGLASAGVAFASTRYLLRFLKQEDKFLRTVIAVAGFG
ncbi:MAG: hypothetical protein N2444_02820, partial [Methylocystis sp.]|nr:hypothetical protein [Methylocystis sp.]